MSQSDTVFIVSVRSDTFRPWFLRDLAEITEVCQHFIFAQSEPRLFLSLCNKARLSFSQLDNLEKEGFPPVPLFFRSLAAAVWLLTLLADLLSSTWWLGGLRSGVSGFVAVAVAGACDSVTLSEPVCCWNTAFACASPWRFRSCSITRTEGR